MGRLKIIAFVLAVATLAGCSPINLTIKWEEDSRHFVGRGVYGRIKRVGDRDARKFCNRSTPLPDLNENGSALWNSLVQIDDTTVIAVMSVGGMEQGKNGIWTVKGEITKR